MKEIFNVHKHHLYYRDKNREDITIGITMRNGGYSKYPEDAFNMARYIDDNPENITKHQEILANEIGFQRENWVFPIQTHGNNVVEVVSKDKGSNIDELTTHLNGVDGLYTYERNLLLTMCYADCVPLYLYDVEEKGSFIALGHAGWRGTQSEIIKQLINHFPENKNRLKVVIGPSTSDSYEINEDIYNKFKSLPIDITEYTEKRGIDRYGIDLKKANRLLAIHYGIPKENISITNHSTADETDMFFSYRIEEGHTGRMLAFIGRK